MKPTEVHYDAERLRRTSKMDGPPLATFQNKSGYICIITYRMTYDITISSMNDFIFSTVVVWLFKQNSVLSPSQRRGN